MTNLEMTEWAKENLRIRVHQNAYGYPDATVFLEVREGDTEDNWYTISDINIEIPEDNN